MATPNYKPLLNSSENLKALLAEQNAEGIASAVFSGNEPIDVLSAKTIFNAAKSAEDISGVSSITAGTGISVSGATGNVTITSTVTGTLPTQTGNSGKLLTTDGTNSSWTTTPVATSLTGPAATSLNLSGGSSGASLVLGQGGTAGASLAIRAGGRFNLTAAASNDAYLEYVGNAGTAGTTSVAVGQSGTGLGIIYNRSNAALTFGTNSLERGRFTETGNLLIGTTTDMASTAGGLTVAATGSGATATAVNTGGLRSANFGLSTVLGGASYFGGTAASTGVGTGALQVAGGIYSGAASVFGSTVTSLPASAAQQRFSAQSFSGNYSAGYEIVSAFNGGTPTAAGFLFYPSAYTGNNVFGEAVSTPQSILYQGNTTGSLKLGTTQAGADVRVYQGSTLALTIGAAGAATFAGLVFPQQATTAGAPAYVKGAIYFDTTLNKLRVGGATAWETITSA